MVCLRCGRCCKLMVLPNMWEEDRRLSYIIPFPDGSKRESDKYINILLEERKKYPIKDHAGCDMLVFEDGLAVCLVQKVLGLEFKPKTCRDFLGEKYMCPEFENMGEDKNGRTKKI